MVLSYLFKTGEDDYEQFSYEVSKPEVMTAIESYFEEKGFGDAHLSQEVKEGLYKIVDALCDDLAEPLREYIEEYFYDMAHLAFWGE